MKPAITPAEPLLPAGRTHVIWRERRLCYFGGCDYFRLTSHPRILRAVREGLRKYGLSVSASRMTTGNHPLYQQLEQSLARFFRVETATLAPNGWTPNAMVAEALAGQFSHALIDARAHHSLSHAARLLDCPVVKFEHRDVASLERVMRRLVDIKPLVMTDGMFSHDGSVAPLDEYLAVLPRGGRLLVDDAHGAGTLGWNGRGTPELLGLSRTRVIQTITLSKAFGVFGGAVLGPHELRGAIIQRSAVFTGSTPLPLPLAYAAMASLKILREDKSLRQRLGRNLTFLRDKLRAAGMPVANTPGPIVSLVPQNRRQAVQLARNLIATDIHPPLINYPGGPEGGYFRFVISSQHTFAQLDRLATVLIHARATFK